MKEFKTICRQLRSLKELSIKPTPHVGFSTSSYYYDQKKKVNPYEEVDQEKYSNTVRSILSLRGHGRTPDSLFEEDALLYGPVSKCKPPKQDEETIAGNRFPLFNRERIVKPNAACSPATPLKIPLQKNIPSVTRVLQQTMTSEQLFYLERWKKRMVMELGEDGFAEYTSNIFLQGKQFHEAVETILSSQGNLDFQERSENLKSGYIESIQHILKDVSAVRALESAVQHKTLKYVGLMDCVAEYQFSVV